MKNHIALIFLLLLIRVSAQTEPPILMIDFTKIEVNQDSILNNYKIRAIVYNDDKKNASYYIEKEELKSNVFSFREGFILTPFYDRDCENIIKINKNKVIILSIIHKNHRMNLFIKSDRYIGIDQYLILENLSFTEGNYFYDMNDKNIESNMETVIDLSNLNSHKISKDDLNRVLKEK